MIHTEIPTQDEIADLFATRVPGCVSIFMETSPVPAQNESAPVEFTTLARQAIDQLAARYGDDAEGRALIAGVEEQIDDLLTDDYFWRHLSHSLAVFVTPDSLRTFRLPNRLKNAVEVSDRLHVKPLLRAVTFPQAAFVLALSQNAVRLVEVTADSPAHTVEVPALPSDAVDAVSVPSISGRFWSGQIQGSEGKKVRLRQYSRAVDNALRPILSGREIPLILAATEPLSSIYRSVNGYPHLATSVIEGNPDDATDAQLADRSRAVLDGVYAEQLAAERERFESMVSRGRTETDVAAVARDATYGAIDTLLVDIDVTVPGSVDEDSGEVTLSEADDAVNYGVVDEILRRAYASGARVLALRAEDMPRETPVAAILRFSRKA